MKWDTPDALAAYLEDNPTSDAMQAAAATIRAQARKITDLESAIKRQGNAAISGMNAAKASATHDLQAAQRLRAESSPEKLASERAANAALTEEIEQRTRDRDAFADAAAEAQVERDAARDERDKLRAALSVAAQALAWQAFGDCWGFDAPLCQLREALEQARAALSGESNG